MPWIGLSEQPDPDLGDDVRLLRRAAPRCIEPKLGTVKFGAFNLRIQQGEKALSLYDASLTTCDALLLDAPPDPGGWGVASISVGALRALGFTVRREIDATDAIKGEAHVAAVPSEYAEDGQIPQEVRARMASAATWERQPDRSKIH